MSSINEMYSQGSMISFLGVFFARLYLFLKKLSEIFFPTEQYKTYSWVIIAEMGENCQTSSRHGNKYEHYPQFWIFGILFLMLFQICYYGSSNIHKKWKLW